MSTQTVNAAVRAEMERLGAMNPVQRYKAAQRLLTALKDHESVLAEMKRAAARELAEVYGWTGGDVAREFKVSRARGYQILNGV